MTKVNGIKIDFGQYFDNRWYVTDDTYDGEPVTAWGDTKGEALTEYLLEMVERKEEIVSITFGE